MSTDAGEVESALEQLSPTASLIRNARLNRQVCFTLPAGRVKHETVRMLFRAFSAPRQEGNLCPIT